jgi:hypothetical protein
VLNKYTRHGGMQNYQNIFLKFEHLKLQYNFLLFFKSITFCSTTCLQFAYCLIFRLTRNAGRDKNVNITLLLVSLLTLLLFTQNNRNLTNAFSDSSMPKRKVRFQSVMFEDAINLPGQSHCASSVR